MTKTVKFLVGMKCDGCSGAIKRILSKINGVEDIQASLETKEVMVICEETVEDQELLNALLKWGSASGKSVELLQQ
jgi:copper chaperone